MKKILDHIEHIKGKPHHVRRKVAFFVATLGSAFIALVWLVGSFATGAFAIQTSLPSTQQGNVVATTSESGDQGAAAVGAAAELQDASAPAHIEIVDTAPAPVKKAEQTVLPF